MSDEAYRGLELDPADTLPQAADLSANAVSINVMSKACGLSGLRSGWVACRDQAVLTALERHKRHTSICNSAPSEYLPTLALRAGAQIEQRNRDIIAADLRHSTTSAPGIPTDSNGNHWPVVRGVSALPRYRGAEGVETCYFEPVETDGVLLLPASLQASDLAPVPTGRFRIASAAPTPTRPRPPSTGSWPDTDDRVTRWPVRADPDPVTGPARLSSDLT